MKWIRSFLMGFLMLLMASGAWAAGTIIVASDSDTSGTSNNVRIISYTVTFDASGGSPDAVALDSIVKSGGGLVPSLKGWWILEINTLYGATAPTVDTDLYLYRYIGTNRIDVFGASGADKIDNATDNTFNPATTSRPLLGTELLSISNNSVASATCTIVFTLYR